MIYFTLTKAKNMEILLESLCEDVSFQILEFLIDLDYTIFRLKDVVKLRSKISNWEYSIKWVHDNGRIDLFMYLMSEAPVDMSRFPYIMHVKVPNKVSPLKPRYAQRSCITGILPESTPIPLFNGCNGSCVANAGLLGILTTENLNVACLSNYEIYLSVAFFAVKVKLYRVTYCHLSHELLRYNYRDKGYSPIYGNVKHISKSYLKNTLIIFESVYNNLWDRFLMLSCVVPYCELLCVKYAIDRGATNSSRCLRKLLNLLNKNPTMCSIDHLELVEYLLTKTGKHKTKLMIDCVRTVKCLVIVCQTNLSWRCALILGFQSADNRISAWVEPYYDTLCRTISHNCLLERTVVVLKEKQISS